MAFSTKSNRDGVFKGIFAAYAILVLHVLLIAGVGLLIIFFSGIVRYLPWIVAGGIILILGSAYLVYRRMKREGKTLSEMLRKPQFQGRSVEIGVLGGLITMKLSKPNYPPAIDYDDEQPLARLEDPETVRIREIAALGRLLEKELITPEEFEHAKQRLLHQ